MVKVLINDPIADKGISMLEEKGFDLDKEKVPQDELPDVIDNYEAIVVRSGTKLRKPLLEKTDQLKFIGRAGVGLDNIDVEVAESMDIHVANTPAASSRSVAELVFSHLAGMVRFLPQLNRKMPEKGATSFKEFKKAHKGRELRNRTLGIIGFGRIGQATAHIALGLGMEVIAYDVVSKEVNLHYNLNGKKVDVRLATTDDKDHLLKNSDFITVHIPFKEGQRPALMEEDFKKMTDKVGIVNCSRGGAVKETDLIAALDEGQVAYAGLDVYEGEPSPRKELLQHPNVSLTPHIGATTEEAQERVSVEMAEKIINFFQ